MTKTTKTERITEFQRDNLSFDVIDKGPLEGHPIVLLHGFPETANIWKQSSEILNQQGFRTYAVNQRGYSLKAQPVGRKAYATQHLVADINQLLDLIDQPVSLIGHDWGAVVAWEVALQYPVSRKNKTSNCNFCPS